MEEELNRLTRVSKEAMQTVGSVKIKTASIEADLKTLAHNIQGFSEEDIEDNDHIETHTGHRALHAHYDNSTTDSAIDRRTHEHDFGIFIGKLPSATTSDDSVRKLFDDYGGLVSQKPEIHSYQNCFDHFTSRLFQFFCNKRHVQMCELGPQILALALV